MPDRRRRKAEDRLRMSLQKLRQLQRRREYLREVRRSEPKASAR